ncbi:hypothetical protein QBC35DRAFT_474113 [Podospora australis]|uniref:Swiss Army Knife RNA repair protein HAD domain-containing protein n=1 Tax=Podospora australis TaxID=1536484 RepID=A0AAN7AJF1_9PEZI|nr:hypothetical protein QBC35DRAFT_474113 [Podospora australis]
MVTSAFAAFRNAAPNGNTGHDGHTNPTPYTVTAMGRWSILNKQLPVADEIKEIHVYDFDNTLFKTPLPNPKIWNGPTIGSLSNPDAFVNGGWWHDSRILAATGEGLAKEEPRAWNGWWNETIVELVKLSAQQKDALCVLLTGRSESGFSDIVKRMVDSKGLEFDLMSLKPAVGPNNERFASTIAFKHAFLEVLMETYKYAEEIRIYEDRVKHVKSFQDFLANFNKKQSSTPTRGPINGEVIHVADMVTYLDPIVEVAEVEQIVKDHNASLAKRRRGIRGEKLTIRKSIFYTGYLINSADAQRLVNLMPIPQLPESELKYHANNIMICPRPCAAHVLEKVGGIGSKMKWEVTHTACFENNIWAVRVRPVPADARIHTSGDVPLVVLALRKGARHVDAGKIQSWQPISPAQSFVFETTVGEKVLLRVEGLSTHESSYDNQKGAKRRHTAGEDNFRSRHGNHPAGGHGGHGTHGGHGGHAGHGHGNQRGNFHTPAGRGGAGRGGGFRGGGRGAGGGGFRGSRGGPAKGGRGGRGGGGGGDRGGAHHYKSLDDVGGRDSQGGFAQMYEDVQATIPKGPSNPQNPGFYQQGQPKNQNSGGWQQGGQQQQGRFNNNGYGGQGGGGGGGGGGNGGEFSY